MDFMNLMNLMNLMNIMNSIFTFTYYIIIFKKIFP